MSIRRCECGSENIYRGLYVQCLDCGLRTRSYQLTIGDYQSEERAARCDWEFKRYETEEQKERREKTEEFLRSRT